MSYNGLSNRIIIPVIVTNDKGVSKEFPGLIDTGATNTCVSAELAKELGFTPIGVTETGTANGKTQVNVYVGDLSLCQGRVHFSRHKVLEVNLTEQQGVEILIGMDILIQGDFAITHKDGRTVASFRVPSIAKYDFVPQAEIANKFEAEQARRMLNRIGKKHKR